MTFSEDPTRAIASRSPNVAALLALGLLTLVRFGVAAWAPLAPDETYYWVWSRALQPGYLDHPPMVALWIRLGTAFAGETALGVRLLGPLSGLVGSFLLADAAERLYPGRRLGVPAAVLLNATLMVGAGAVTMTPDTPLLFFVVVALWGIARAASDPRWWIVVGVAIGAAATSKYTGILIGVAVPLWLLWIRGIRGLSSAWLWVGGAAAVAVFAPVLLWNADHGWVSFLKQGGRAGAFRPARAVQFMSELLVGQVGLATPGIFVVFAAGLRGAIVAAWHRVAPDALLVALALPGLLLFLEHALGDRVQANWLAVLYPPLAIAGAAAGLRWWRGAAWLGAGLTAIVYLQAAAAPFPLPLALDPTLARLAGWGGVARDLDALRQAEGVPFVASDNYAEGSELAWWSPPGTEVLGVEARWLLFRLPRAPDGAGLLLVSERHREAPDPALWQEAHVIGHLTRARAGVEAERFRVYRAVLRSSGSAVILPRRGGE